MKRDKNVSHDENQESGKVARVRKPQWKARTCRLRIRDSNLRELAQMSYLLLLTQYLHSSYNMQLLSITIPIGRIVSEFVRNHPAFYYITSLKLFLVYDL